MKANIHFISGLPRSGSTLVSALLNQNPAFHAGTESPLADLLIGALRMMSDHGKSISITDRQRERIAKGIIESYYGDMTAKGVVFDSHRVWSALLPLVAVVEPSAQLVCCVRNPAWILDSMERLVQRNALWMSKIFGQETHSTVYSRTMTLSKGMVGTSLSALRQAWFSEHAQRLVVIRYDSLVSRPAETLAALYERLGYKPFEHDFEHVHYEEPSFDAALGLPGMHTVVGPVLARTRETVLPPDVFAMYNQEFWSDSGSNPRNVLVL
jgi:sulfotransferase